MELICKARVYTEKGRYFSVLVTPHLVSAGTGQSVGEALERLGQSVIRGGSPSLARLILDKEKKSEEANRRQQDLALRGVFNSSILVKRLIFERFGKITLREFSTKLDVQGVSPQLLSSSIGGKGSLRVRLSIARALGEDASILWQKSPAVEKAQFTSALDA